MDGVILVRLTPGGSPFRLWVEVRAGREVADSQIDLQVPVMIDSYRDIVTDYRSTPPAQRSGLRVADRVIEIGRELFESVLGHGAVGQLYRQARRDNDHAGVATHVVLEFRDTPHLLGLPWEALWDPSEHAHVALRHGLSRVIHRAAAPPYRSRSMPDRLQVLGIVAQPDRGYPVLDVAAEQGNLDRTFAHGGVRRRARLTWAPNATLVGLQERLRTPWDVVHFIGHGEFGPDAGAGAAAAGQGRLVLVRADGDPEPVGAGAFELLFPARAGMPRLVVLNACESATISAGDVFSSTAGVLVQRGADVVVAMQRPIKDDAAIRFAEHFYGTLAGGLAVQEAVQAGRVGLFGPDENDLGWLAPVVYLQRADIECVLLPTRNPPPGSQRGRVGRWARAGAAFVRRRPRPVALIAVLALVALVALVAWRMWPGGRAAPAATVACPAQDTPATSGTALFADTDNPQDFSEDCYGFIDSVDSSSSFVFGRDPDTTALERDLLTDNPVTSDGETLVWFGGISCQHYVPGQPERCSSPSDRRYDAEHDELAALLLFKIEWAQQRQDNPDLPTLHLVLANAGPDVAHADRVAQALVEHRQAFSQRIAVIGGGDSRFSTQQAIQHLVRAGIPMIAPTLSADHGEPTASGASNDTLAAYTQLGPFVADPGYMALSTQEDEYVQPLVNGLKTQYPKGVDVTIYTSTPTSSPPSIDDFSDLFITSQIADLKNGAERHPTRPDDPTRPLVALSLATPQHPMTTSVCQRATGIPSVVVFSDRWDKFVPFAAQLTDLCKGTSGGVPMVISPGSVGRVLAGDDALQALQEAGADWPLMYFSGGLQCDGLQQVRDAYGSVDDPNRKSPNQASKLLWQAQNAVRPAADPHPGKPVLGVDCPKRKTTPSVAPQITPNVAHQITPSVAQMWDSAVLAQQILDRLPKNRDSRPEDLANLSLTGYLSQGLVEIKGGKVLTGHRLIKVIVLCVRSLTSGEGRAEKTCKNPPTDKDAPGLGLKPLTDAIHRTPTYSAGA